MSARPSQEGAPGYVGVRTERLNQDTVTTVPTSPPPTFDDPSAHTPGEPRWPVLRFWLVATGLEVLLAAVLLGSGGDASVSRGLEAAGMEFNTDLVTAVRVLLVYPAAALGVLLALAQVAAPDLAVLLVARRTRAGVGSLTAVIRRFRFWSTEVGAARGARVWAQMLGAFLALSLATAGLNALLLPAGEWRWSPHLLSVGVGGGALLVTVFLDAGALLEENGWRGYALPMLLRRCSPLTASLVLGLAWASWHYPVKYNALTDYGVGGLGYLAAFTVKIILTTVVMTYFWQRAGQATIIAIAMHGLSNDSMRLQGQLIGDNLQLSVLSELTICAPLAVAAALLVWRTRGRLGCTGADTRRGARASKPPLATGPALSQATADRAPRLAGFGEPQRDADGTGRSEQVRSPGNSRASCLSRRCAGFGVRTPGSAPGRGTTPGAALTAMPPPG